MTCEDDEALAKLQGTEPSAEPMVAEEGRGIRPMTVHEICLGYAGGDEERASRTQLVIDGRGRVTGALLKDEPLRPQDHAVFANRKMRRSMAKQRRAGKL